MVKPCRKLSAWKNWLDDPDYVSVVLVDVDVTRLLGKAEKINVTLPSLLIRRIAQFVAAHPEYDSRSGFLSHVAADKVIGRENVKPRKKLY